MRAQDCSAHGGESAAEGGLRFAVPAVVATCRRSRVPSWLASTVTIEMWCSENIRLPILRLYIITYRHASPAPYCSIELTPLHRAPPLVASSHAAGRSAQ